jgi:hypothetical protein
MLMTGSTTVFECKGTAIPNCLLYDTVTCSVCAKGYSLQAGAAGTTAKTCLINSTITGVAAECLMASTVATGTTSTKDNTICQACLGAKRPRAADNSGTAGDASICENLTATAIANCAAYKVLATTEKCAYCADTYYVATDSSSCTL